MASDDPRQHQPKVPDPWPWTEWCHKRLSYCSFRYEPTVNGLRFIFYRKENDPADPAKVAWKSFYRVVVNGTRLFRLRHVCHELAWLQPTDEDYVGFGNGSVIATPFCEAFRDRHQGDFRLQVYLSPLPSSAARRKIFFLKLTDLNPDEARVLRPDTATIERIREGQGEKEQFEAERSVRFDIAQQDVEAMLDACDQALRLSRYGMQRADHVTGALETACEVLERNPALAARLARALQGAGAPRAAGAPASGKPAPAPKPAPKPAKAEPREVRPTPPARGLRPLPENPARHDEPLPDVIVDLPEERK